MKYCPACHKTYPGDYNVCPGDQTALQSSREFQAGMIIRNKYEILARIGIGGMGVVYRGRHLTFNEVCAIKILNDSTAEDKTFLQRFQTEAVVTRKLRHPNAVRVDDFDYTDDGRPFIVMELVEGRNVGEVLQAEGAFEVQRAIRIAVEVGRALGEAHRLGFVHRDIKPGNIVLTKNDQGCEIAKVLDFGIAKLRQAAGDATSGMTMTGMVVGTPLYMSPEQFMGKKAGEEIDGRTDLYSLGVVLYQMVTAQLPFEGDTLYSLMMQHIHGNVRPPDEIAPDRHIPSSLSRVILKSIDKAREARYQSADEFIAALEQVGVETSTSKAVVTPPAVAVPSVAATPAITPTPQVSAVAPPVSAVAVTIAKSTTPSNVAAPSASVPLSTPAPAQPVVLPGPPTTPLPKSAAQHVFVQHRSYKARNVVMMIVLALALVVIGGIGFLKYRSMQRMRIEKAVMQSLQAAPASGLRSAHISVSVSDTGEVILDGNVPSPGDSSIAEGLALAVGGVTHVNNRLQVVQPPPPPGNQAESSDALVTKGMAFMDAGDYPSAIDCFTRASGDPNNKSAKELLDLARRAQETEGQLMKNRH
ncbi:MAG TPA: protein kinase [Blastocatellia bacterium]|nr:protein kinase [Blastocatellia bacterium]